MTEPGRRWDAPWTAPVGAQPQREPGEPSFGVLAALHLGAWFGLGSLASAFGAIGNDPGTAGASYAVLALLLLVAGGAAWSAGRRSANRLWDWTADLLLASGAGFAGAASALLSVAGGSDSDEAAAIAAVAGSVTAVIAGGAYVLVRRTWLLLTTVGALAVALVGLTQQGEDSSVVLTGALLVVLASLVAAGAIAGALRPVGAAYTASALVAVAGAQVMLAGDDGPDAAFGLGYAVSALVLGAIAYAVVRTRNASVLPVVLLGGFMLLPQLLSPALGGGYAFGLSLLGVGSGVAWLSVDVVRRSVRPVQNGGVFLTCTVFVLLTAPALIWAGNDLVGVVVVLLLGAFFAAAASVRRRPATVLSGFELVSLAPGALADAVDGGSGAATVAGALLVPLAVLAAVWLDKRAPRPAASPYGQEQALTAPGEDATVVGAYPQVFDALVGLLTTAGLALQLVDRAGGRLVAGDAAHPVFVVAVWAADPVRTHLRLVGAPHDTSRLRADLEARLATTATTPYGSS